MSVHRLKQLAAQGDCQLWLVDLDAPAAPKEFDALATDETARAARFTFATHRARFLAGRSALRKVLALHTGRPASALRFETGRFGKPFVADAPQLAFNLSHSEGVGLIALCGESPEPVGVDVEVLRPFPDTLELAAANFEPGECSELAGLSEPARNRAFLAGWTRKEACLKALGSGFSGPARLATGLGLEERAVEWHDGKTRHLASVRSFEIPRLNAIASLARLRSIPRPATGRIDATALAGIP